MSKKAIVILADGFEEIEAISVIDILRRAGIEVTVAGLHDTSIKGSHGITLIADQNLDDIDSDFDACILPGGMPGATHLANSKKVNSLIQLMHKEQKIIAAICASPAVVLATSGILEGKSATCYPGMESNFDKHTRFEEDAVVVDGNIVTSKGVGTAIPFALAIIEELVGSEGKAKVAKAILAN